MTRRRRSGNEHKLWSRASRQPLFASNSPDRQPAVPAGAHFAGRKSQRRHGLLAVSAVSRFVPVWSRPYSLPARHCVRNLFRLSEFPLASPLGSTLSANCDASQPLFEGFSATMGLSDFPHPYVAGVLLPDSQRGPRCHSRPNAGSPGSRVSFFRACAGSTTTRGRSSSCDSELLRVAFRYYDGVGPPKSI